MTDKFGPKAPPGIPINIFKKLASAQGTMGRGKGISFPFPSSPVGSIFPLPRPHSPLIYHTTQRVPCEAERERERGRGSCKLGVFVFVTVQTSKELEPKYTPQVFLGLLVGRAVQLLANFFPVSGYSPRSPNES